MLSREWHRDEGGSSIGRPDVAARPINVDADEIDWSTDRVHILGGDLRSVRTGSRPLVDASTQDKMAIVLEEIVKDKIYLDSSQQVRVVGEFQGTGEAMELDLGDL